MMKVMPRIWSSVIRVWAVDDDDHYAYRYDTTTTPVASSPEVIVATLRALADDIEKRIPQPGILHLPDDMTIPPSLFKGTRYSHEFVWRNDGTPTLGCRAVFDGVACRRPRTAPEHHFEQ